MFINEKKRQKDNLLCFLCVRNLGAWLHFEEAEKHLAVFSLYNHPLQRGLRIYPNSSEAAVIFLSPSIVKWTRCQERCLAVCVWAKPIAERVFPCSVWGRAAAWVPWVLHAVLLLSPLRSVVRDALCSTSAWWVRYQDYQVSKKISQ